MLSVFLALALQFAAYEGNAIRTGEGGTRVTNNGVDFWTTGTPPRKYQILGVLTDRRYDSERSMIGSPGVARLVRRYGGDAVIVLDQRNQKEDYGIAGLGATETLNVTELQVIKYLGQ